MNIVIITSGKRPELLAQTINSLVAHAIGTHHHTIVVDGYEHYTVDDCNRLDTVLTNAHSLIINRDPQGASASRNIGASSIPTYRRQKYVMFSDDDCYYVKGWDEKIERALEGYKDIAVSGHAHPFNHAVGKYRIPDDAKGIIEGAQVLSTVNIAIPWKMWDDVGWFTEPGGAGGSEDVDWCKRATGIKAWGLAVTWPQVVLHTGLTSSRGEPIVGADMVRERNSELEVTHGIVGKVVYQ